jgi:hypothetical protein
MQQSAVQQQLRNLKSRLSTAHFRGAGNEWADMRRTVEGLIKIAAEQEARLLDIEQLQQRQGA